MSNRPCCSPPLRFGVWNARPPKTKVSSLCDLLLSRSLDHLSVTESWLTSNDSITIANLTNSLEDYAVYHLPRSTRRGGGLAVIARKGRSWLLHPVNSLFVVISTFTSMTTQMQTPNNFLSFFFLLICHPLFKLIGNAPWNWSQRCEKAFCAVKCALTSAATVLAHYDPRFPEELSVIVFFNLL